MMDTFRPLHVAKEALGVEDGKYFRSGSKQARDSTRPHRET